MKERSNTVPVKPAACYCLYVSRLRSPSRSPQSSAGETSNTPSPTKHGVISSIRDTCEAVMQKTVLLFEAHIKPFRAVVPGLRPAGRTRPDYTSHPARG
ncbi:hypothetical protein EYF80_034041 [Liparis tanakae]|uniref:Uncharacterized protein n=1 Tax=Liparis tanakae TaxID=230148 RepID=A0A4Z2GR14_9TELE|nr:hypothetical protein EYF80_034041 [Liparis tanakae]